MVALGRGRERREEKIWEREEVEGK